MNWEKRIEEGVPNWVLASVLMACAAPAVTLNVWPRVVAMSQQGITSNQLGIVLLVTLSALGMTCVPFAMKKAPNRSFWWTSLAFGLGLLILNYSMAVGAIGKVRDEDAGTKQLIISRASSIKGQIEEARKLREGLPSFRPTSSEMVASAHSAVALAIQARDQECGRVGDNCRARVAQLTTRQSELQAVLSDLSVSERAESLDKSLRRYEHELISLGPVPQGTDMQASRLANLIGAFVSLGPGAAERVADGLITILALAAEAFALGMPRIIITAIGNGPQRGPHTPTQPAAAPAVLPKPLAEKPIPRPASTPTRRNAISPAPIAQWKELNLIRAAGRVRSMEVYNHYLSWAKTQKLSPRDFPAFDAELQTFHGVKSVEEQKRKFYLDVAIKTPLKAVS